MEPTRVYVDVVDSAGTIYAATEWSAELVPNEHGVKIHRRAVTQKKTLAEYAKQYVGHKHCPNQLMFKVRLDIGGHTNIDPGDLKFEESAEYKTIW